MAEAESDALRFLLRDWPTRVSCALARTEVPRAVRGQDPKAVLRARALLSRTHLLHLDDPLLGAAAALDPQVLRSLDAIHLAAAQSLGETLGAIVTYDQRMADAAKVLGWRSRRQLEPTVWQEVGEDSPPALPSGRRNHASRRTPRGERQISFTQRRFGPWHRVRGLVS